MNHDIGILGVSGEPGVGVGVAAEDDLVTIPRERVANPAVAGMYCRPRANGDAVFLVNDLVLTLVVELVGNDFARNRIDLDRTSHVIPVVGLQEVLDEICGAHVLPRTARPPDFQRRGTSAGPAAGP